MECPGGEDKDIKGFKGKRQSIVKPDECRLKEAGGKLAEISIGIQKVDKKHAAAQPEDQGSSQYAVPKKSFPVRCEMEFTASSWPETPGDSVDDILKGAKRTNCRTVYPACKEADDNDKQKAQRRDAESQGKEAQY